MQHQLRFTFDSGEVHSAYTVFNLIKMDAYKRFKRLLDSWPPLLGVLHDRPKLSKVFTFAFFAYTLLTPCLFLYTILDNDGDLRSESLSILGGVLKVKQRNLNFRMKNIRNNIDFLPISGVNESYFSAVRHLENQAID